MTPRTMPSEEEIARVIAPVAFASSLGDFPCDGGWQDAAWRLQRDDQELALSKARSILALFQNFSPTREEVSGWKPIGSSKATGTEPVLVIATNFKTAPAIIWLPNCSGWPWPNSDPTHYIEIDDLDAFPAETISSFRRALQEISTLDEAITVDAEDAASVLARALKISRTALASAGLLRSSTREEGLEEAARVRVKTTSYKVDGTVVARFKNTKGDKRVVVEFDSPAGLLHIHNPAQLTPLIPQPSPDAKSCEKVEAERDPVFLSAVESALYQLRIYINQNKFGTEEEQRNAVTDAVAHAVGIIRADAWAKNNKALSPSSTVQGWKPSDFEIRKPDGENIDEIVCKEARNLHIEQMADADWYLGFDTPDGVQHQFWFGARNQKTKVSVKHTDSYQDPPAAPMQGDK